MKKKEQKNSDFRSKDDQNGCRLQPENDQLYEYHQRTAGFRKRLENSSFLALIECIGVIVEFVIIMVIFSSLLNTVVQHSHISQLVQSLLEQKIAPTSLYFASGLAKVFEWSLSTILIIIWFTYRYYDRISNPPLSMTPFFGLKPKFTLPSKVLLVVFIIIIFEFIVSINFEMFKNQQFSSYIDALNFDLYFQENQTKSEFIHELMSIHQHENLSVVQFFQLHAQVISKYLFQSDTTIQWNTLYQLIIVTPLLEEFIFRGLLITTFVKR